MAIRLKDVRWVLANEAKTGRGLTIPAALIMTVSTKKSGCKIVLMGGYAVTVSQPYDSVICQWKACLK